MSTPVHCWRCRCGRRVPLRVAVCHCGARREDAPPSAVATPAPARGDAALGWGSLPGDVKALVVAAALTVLGGVGWLVYSPPRPEPLPPLLGYVDVPPPPPVARPPRLPPLRMPWWK